MQPLFKRRKPANLDIQVEDNEEKQQLDTFEEFCSNIPNDENQELNFSKQSNSCSSEDQQIQYIQFVEFHPQSSSNSNSKRIDQDILQEPPAPQNKNLMKFSFPQKGPSFTSLKKQLCMDNNNQSKQSDTLVKQSNIEEELKQQIKELLEQKQKLEQNFQMEIQILQEQNLKLEQETQQQKQKNLTLIQENMLLQSKIEIFEMKRNSDLHNITDFSTDQKLNINDKLIYLIQKLNYKAQENAKLQFEIIQLRNNIELMETQKFLQINPSYLLETAKIHSSQSPIVIPNSQNRGQSLSKDSHNSLIISQKFPLNLSLNYAQATNDQKISINRTNQLISPQYSSVGQCTLIPKNQLYKEDLKMNKIHTKNSTSVGELMSLKQDLTNYSNLIHKANRKESYSTQSPDAKSTQKFKSSLNQKIGSHQENSKSYASLLFSLGDKQKETKQISPKNSKKSKQLFGFIVQPHPNSRKQSEILKSEESHKVSQEQIKQSDKKSNFQQSLDIFQIMRDIRNKKNTISTKICQKKSQTNRQVITEIKSNRTNKPSFD